ncbi:hypothetical protein ACOSP7_017402 [Xanthoceras sorbifolium]
MINSHQPVPFNPATIGFHCQNRSISHLGFVGVGQLGFSQRVKETSRSCIFPNRVQVHSSINYEFLMQNQIALPPNNLISVSEVTSTPRFLTSTSTMEHFLVSRNNIFHTQTSFILDNTTTANCVQGLIENGNSTLPNQSQPNLRNQILLSTNQANQLAEIESICNPYHLTNQTITTPMSTVYGSLINGRNLNLDQNLRPDQLGIMNLQYPNLVEPFRLRVRVFSKGLIVVPVQSINKGLTRVYAQRKENGEEVKREFKVRNEERQGKNGPRGVAKFFHGGLKIKEEPNSKVEFNGEIFKTKKEYM